MEKLNLGCPIFCSGYTCVDLHPHQLYVIKSDVLEYLKTNNKKYDEIYSKNLLEHLMNIDDFILYSIMRLNDGGKLIIITDNAEFIPFYIPLFINHTGLGAHAKDEYANHKTHNGTHHYMIFTKMHLYNILNHFMFRQISVKRITFGSRLKAVAIK